MKRLLLFATTALVLSVLPAKASFVAVNAEDADDIDMFIANVKNMNAFTGSVTGNGSHFTVDLNFSTNVNVDTASGNANIKPVSPGLLTSITMTPATGFTFDGMITQLQLENDTGNPLITTGGFSLSVNGGTTLGTDLFHFTKDFNSDALQYGFEEPDDANRSLITSVVLTSDTGFSFKEVKQLAWSSDGPITGAIPETSTWAMMLLGFLGIGVFGMRKKFEGFRFA